MKISQSLRRLQWRARRLFSKPADNAPIVTMETAPPAKPAPRRPGVVAPIARIIRLALAFLITLLVLGLAYVWLVASESRVAVTLDAASEGEVQAGSKAVMAAATLLAEAAAPASGIVEQNMLLAPTSRRAREAFLDDGAADALARFLEAYQARGARREQTLTDARFALAEGGAGRAAARTALIQFNDRVARGLFRPDVSKEAHQAVVAAAAAALAAHADSLHAAVDQGAQGQGARGAERLFYRARGAALAWRRSLLGWVADAPAIAARARREALEPGLAMLAKAAAFQPTLLANAAPESSFQPNHLSHLALLISLASLRLSAAVRGA